MSGGNGLNWLVDKVKPTVSAAVTSARLFAAKTLAPATAKLLSTTLKSEPQ